MFAWLLKNPLEAVAGLAIIGLVIFSGVKMVEVASLEADVAAKQVEITTLNFQKKALETSVLNLNLQIGQVKQAQKALEEAMAAQAKSYQNENDNQKEIDNAPATDNGPLAPVLRRALERM